MKFINNHFMIVTYCLSMIFPLKASFSSQESPEELSVEKRAHIVNEAPHEAVVETLPPKTKPERLRDFFGSSFKKKYLDSNYHQEHNTSENPLDILKALFDEQAPRTYGKKRAQKTFIIDFSLLDKEDYLLKNNILRETGVLHQSEVRFISKNIIEKKILLEAHSVEYKEKYPATLYYSQSDNVDLKMQDYDYNLCDAFGEKIHGFKISFVHFSGVPDNIPESIKPYLSIHRERADSLCLTEFNIYLEKVRQPVDLNKVNRGVKQKKPKYVKAFGHNKSSKKTRRQSLIETSNGRLKQKYPRTLTPYKAKKRSKKLSARRSLREDFGGHTNVKISRLTITDVDESEENKAQSRKALGRKGKMKKSKSERNLHRPLEKF